MLFAPFVYSWMAWFVGVSEPIGISGHSLKIAVISLVARCSLQLFQYGLRGPVKHETSISVEMVSVSCSWMPAFTRWSMYISVLTSLCVSLNFMRCPLSICPATFDLSGCPR